MGKLRFSTDFDHISPRHSFTLRKETPENGTRGMCAEICVTPTVDEFALTISLVQTNGGPVSWDLDVFLQITNNTTEDIDVTVDLANFTPSGMSGPPSQVITVSAGTSVSNVLLGSHSEPAPGLVTVSGHVDGLGLTTSNNYQANDSEDITLV